MLHIKFDEFIDELEFYQEDRTINYMLWTTAEAEGEVRILKTSLSPPVDRSNATLLWWFLLFYALGLNYCALAPYVRFHNCD